MELRARTGGNENTGLLKLIALVFMVVDHCGVAFFPQVRELRILGRIAFPLYVWCLCVGAEHTRNPWKYALRLLIVGIIAQACYMLGLNHKWSELSVYATLLAGLLGIIAIRENKFGSRYWGPVIAVLLACAVKMDYGWRGVLFILLMYGCRRDRRTIGALMVAYSLYFGHSSYAIASYFGLPAVTDISFLPEAKSLLSDINRVQFWQILALPLMLWPMKSRLHLPKWAGYAAYPGHLLVIGVIRHWGEITAFLASLT